MRISDWSSDVCSSDLQQLRALRQSAADADPLPLAAGKLVGPLVHHVVEADAAEQAESLIDVRLRELAEPAPPEADVAEAPGEHVLHHRSEEHTSELQSLMRISYAVFCLKKKNEKRHKQNIQ